MIQTQSDNQWPVARIDFGVSRLYLLSFSSKVLSVANTLSIISSFKNILYTNNMFKQTMMLLKVLSDAANLTSNLSILFGSLCF